ncbi:hypothetical protein G1K66_06685 [Tenacibaculum finnmarkense]|uniref:SHOCT domain-containing protein n=1 Tax=Tenacibaculum finnmarkense TaxID=2781243 RepID=UPI00187B5984|nr:SHOCT domain-containing protein [Tenacibaculum finnmarkense]MBE7634277.1 hypothetical protein [Tenacibaculum finnmarkense genomovar ulcerans]MCD8430225.1 SHOCT domain-containing protein [Tenacibaculum finnmarkense genomovar ulcerans]MCG8812953.1 hypothetical protein [Tenacibaculum finnmarkense]
MDKGIGVGIIVALTFTSTIFILQSNYFSKNQKIILGILFVFPPAQWVLALIIGIWNKQSESTIGFKIDNANKSDDEIEKLKNLGLLSEEEYKDKKEKVLEMKLNELVLKSEGYISLKKLKQNNILTQEEFEQKSEILKNEILEQVNSSEFENTEKNKVQKNSTSDIPTLPDIPFLILIVIFIILMLAIFFKR